MRCVRVLAVVTLDTTVMRPALIPAIILGAICVLGQRAVAQGTAFTYQGRLSGAAGAVNGLYDMRFEAYASSASGAPLGSQTHAPVVVSNGLFTVSLNLGTGVFTGPPRWIEIAVRPNGSGSPFEVLTPRQQITPTPYAMVAGNVTGSVTSLDSPSGGPADALSIDRFGHVAIGTNDTGAALQVAGGTNLFSPGQLQLLTVVTNGWPGVSNFTAPVNVFVQGTRAYVTTYVPGSLQIFNVFNPAQPQFLGEVVDDSGRPGSPFTRLAGLDGVYVTNGLAYVTSESENAVTIINVANPQAPVKVAEIVDGVGGFNGLNLPTGVLVQGTNLFVLGFLDSALSIINIANPGNPQLIREIYDDSAVPGSPFTKLQYPYQMTLIGTKLYIAARGDHAITVLDVANPASPQIVAEMVDDSVNPGSQFTKLRDVNWVEVVGNIAYAVSGAFNGGADHSLTIIDISDPANPVKLSEVSDETVQPGSPFTKLRGAWAIKVSRNTAFVTSFGDNALSVIDVSNPRAPRLLRELVDGQDGFNTLNFTEGLTVVGNTLYVLGDGDSAMNIFNLPSRSLGMVVDGLVGIGTDTPRSALDVAGTISTENLDATGEGSFGSLSVAGSVTVDRTGVNAGALQPGLVFGNRLAEGIASRQTPGGNQGGLDFYTFQQPRLSISGGGFVGVGTPSPQTPMHLYSGFNPTTLRIQSAAGPGFGRIEFFSDPQFSANEWRPGFIQSVDNGNFTGGIAFVVNGTGLANRFGGIEVMRVVNGAVGIGTFSPAFTLHVNGSAGKPGGGSWSVASDERLKKDIRPLEDSLARLLQLRGVTFEYRDPKAIHELPGRQTGLIAQEVERVFPEWIDTRPNGMKSLSVRGFEALTVEALRELREEKDREIVAIKAQNTALEKRLEHLENLISTLARAK
jgi:hypothetical protein